jgi:hypothetical protein
LLLTALLLAALLSTSTLLSTLLLSALSRFRLLGLRVLVWVALLLVGIIRHSHHLICSSDIDTTMTKNLCSQFGGPDGIRTRFARTAT